MAFHLNNLSEVHEQTSLFLVGEKAPFSFSFLCLPRGGHVTLGTMVPDGPTFVRNPVVHEKILCHLCPKNWSFSITDFWFYFSSVWHKILTGFITDNVFPKTGSFDHTLFVESRKLSRKVVLCVIKEAFIFSNSFG